MKKLTIVLALVALLSGCTSANQFGQCIGAFDEGTPGVKYKPSGWNIAMGIIFVETIVAPLVVIFDQTLCPTNLPKVPNENEPSKEKPW